MKQEWSYYKKTVSLPSSDKCSDFLAHVPLNGRILDIGAGTGRFAAAFKRDRPDIKVDALESEDTALVYLRSHEGINILHMRMEQFEVEAHTYDAIWANHSLFFLSQKELLKVLRQLKKAIKPQSFLFMSFIKEDAKPNPYPDKFIRLNEIDLRSTLEKFDFKIIKMRECDGRFGKEEKLATYFAVRAISTTS